MAFDLEEAVAVLERTPAALRGLLGGLPDAWTTVDEGPGTWSPYEVVGHLIHGEKNAWIPRMRHLLEAGDTRPFTPFDRFAQQCESRQRTLADLLDEFAAGRAASLGELAALRLTPADLERVGAHPEFGRITLGQLLATWAVHDLGHLAQACRVMAGRYREEVGPWSAYLPILAPRR